MKTTALIAWLLVCLSSQAYAQSREGGVYPSRPVRIVTAFVPGSSTGDVVARAVAKRLSDSWGQPVVVDPRPGAGQVIATDLVAKAPSDGYTLLMVSASFSVNPSLHSKLPFDSIRDLTPITLMSFIPYLLVVHPSVPVRTFQELIAYAKAKPGALNYGAAGTQNQLAIELLKLKTGIDMVHVAYRGASLVITDLVAGQIHLALGTALAVLPHVNSGRLRGLAVTSARRVSAVPDLPTIAESGVPGFDVSAWNGVFVPAGVPAPIVVKLSSDIGAAVKAPDLRARLTAEGGEVVGNSSEEFARFIRDDIAMWAKVVKAVGSRAE
jgi:tripartite-type tricarboxylate transporter receptor subunit TctC